ncbi:hypothetical protein [Orbus mooreae]|uniref:hypothetical protein n=1 Tax=Orbus mooreae TaxID=3074107 RepID=UPI00370D25D8
MSFLVLKELKKRLEEGFCHALLEKKDNLREAPRLYIGQLPPKEGSKPPSEAVDKKDNDYPFILIRSISGDLSNDATGQPVYNFNVALIIGIYSQESYESYQDGVQIVSDTLDKSLLIINQYEYWGNSHFALDHDMSWGYGLGKTIDPYACGLQTDAPYFLVVLNLSFSQFLKLPKVEIQYLV